MTVQIIRGDALHLPLADESVDLVCTSPPYFGLRSYQDGGQHYAGQLGSETTPAEFVDALLAATREMVRVLKPSGSIWVNLGDKYAGSGPGPGQAGFGRDGSNIKNAYGVRGRQGSLPVTDIRPKSLMGIPWRYALACIDQLGLILRAEIIWNKPNGLPESVTDRVRRSHESWFHLVKQPRYYSAVDEIRQEHVRDIRPNELRGISRDNGKTLPPRGPSDLALHVPTFHPLGKLPGSVWTIPTEPLTVPDHLGVDHFAAFPTEWPRRIIAGWSPPGICTACGQGRRPTYAMDWNKVPHRMEWRRNREPTRTERVEFGRVFSSWWRAFGISRTDFVAHFPHYKNADSVKAQVSNWDLGKNVPMPDDMKIIVNWLGPAPERLWDIVGEMAMMPVVAEGIATGPEGSGRHRNTLRNRQGVHLDTGYACGCPTPDAPTRPSVVLDPFGGTGTTALVADVLGRHAIHIDLSHDYNRLARWRINNPDQRAKAARVDKPPPVMTGQLDLLTLGDL